MKERINNPQERTVIDELVQLPMNLYTIRRIFLLLTRLHYSSPTNFGPEYPKALHKFIWTPNEDSPIKIDYDYNYEPQNLEKTPAIYVGTGDIDYGKQVVNNSRGANADRSGEEFVKSAGSTIILRHVSGEPDETTQLADMTVQFYLGIRKLIMEQLSKSARSFEVVKQSSSKPFLRDPGQGDQHFIVDVIMQMQFQAMWTTFVESHRVKTFGYEQALKEVQSSVVTK